MKKSEQQAPVPPQVIQYQNGEHHRDRHKRRLETNVTKREWARFFELMDKIVHSNELTYREIGLDIVEAAQLDGEQLGHETEVWLETFVNIFEGSLMCKVGQKLDLEMADMRAEDLIAEDEADELDELNESNI